MEEETYAIVTTGGPYPGVHYVGSWQYNWPLPGLFLMGSGSYVKMYDTDSLFPRQDMIVKFPAVSPEMKTAFYRWNA